MTREQNTMNNAQAPKHLNRKEIPMRFALRALLAIAGVFALALAFASCGDDRGHSSTTTPAPAETVATAPTTPAARSDLEPAGLAELAYAPERMADGQAAGLRFWWKYLDCTSGPRRGERMLTTSIESNRGTYYGECHAGTFDGYSYNPDPPQGGDDPLHLDGARSHTVYGIRAPEPVEPAGIVCYGHNDDQLLAESVIRRACRRSEDSTLGNSEITYCYRDDTKLHVFDANWQEACIATIP